jgi:hypothetical protein
MNDRYLPPQIMDHIFKHLTIETATIARGVSTMFNTPSLKFNKEEFDKLLSNMIEAYKEMYVYFLHHPIGYGMGDEMQLSMIVGGDVVFTMDGDRIHYNEKVRSNADISKVVVEVLPIELIKKSVQIKVTFIHDIGRKNLWQSPSVDLLGALNSSAIGLAKSVFKNNFSNQQLLKYLVAYILISQYKSVFITKKENTDTNYTDIINTHFEKIDNFPVKMDAGELERKQNVVKAINENMKKGPVASYTPLEEYKPLENVDAIKKRIIEETGGEDIDYIKLGKITNINVEKLRNLPECDDSNLEKLGRMNSYNEFFKSTIQFTQYMNNIVIQTGGKNKKNKNKNKKQIKPIYVKTDRKHIRGSYSSIIYTCGIYDYIRVKKDDVFIYRKIKF